MSLRERWEFVCSAIKEGYILKQYNLEEEGIWITTDKNKEIGVFLDEILDVMNGECEV